MSRYIPRLLFRVTVLIFRNILFSFFLEAIKTPLSAEKNWCVLRGKCIKVVFCFFHFWDLIFWKLFMATTGLVQRVVSGASRRQTKGDFLRASAPLARGRWWGWQIAANFRCTYRIAGEIAEKCSRCDREGEDFEWCVFMGLLGTWE